MEKSQVQNVIFLVKAIFKTQEVALFGFFHRKIFQGENAFGPLWYQKKIRVLFAPSKLWFFFTKKLISKNVLEIAPFGFSSQNFPGEQHLEPPLKSQNFKTVFSMFRTCVIFQQKMFLKTPFRFILSKLSRGCISPDPLATPLPSVQAPICASPTIS